jgi:formate-dependent nitrite reductase membrane component NrfD
VTAGNGATGQGPDPGTEAGAGAGSVTPPDVTAHETAALTTPERTQGANGYLSHGGAGQSTPSGVGRHRRGGRAGRDGPEMAVVPPAQFQSYYGRPVLKAAPWQAREIAGYFFLGGLAGASSLLAEGARLTGRPALERGSKVTSALAINLSLAALAKDLGRPARVLNMLRVAKPSSPMSMGTWLLSGYGPLATASAGSAVTGRARRLGALAGTLAAAAGPAVASYTAVLLADTATPAWHAAGRELPYVFVASAATAAGGMGMLVAPVAEAGPARRLAAVGSLVEGVLTEVMQRRLGLVGEVYEQGRAGRAKTAATALSVAGALLGVTAGRRSRIAAGVAGLALITGSACMRFAVFYAGQQSVADPKYTVVPQRERVQSAG